MKSVDEIMREREACLHSLHSLDEAKADDDVTRLSAFRIPEEFPTIEEFVEEYCEPSGISTSDPDEVYREYQRFDRRVRDYKSLRRYLTGLRKEATTTGFEVGWKRAFGEDCELELEDEWDRKNPDWSYYNSCYNSSLENAYKEGLNQGASAQRACFALAMREQGIDEETIERVLEFRPAPVQD